MSDKEGGVPRDSRIISIILRSLGIEECSPKVLVQILEFAYKFSTDLLEDANLYADYAGRKTITAADMKLAIQTKAGKYFVTPCPRQFMAEIASAINSKPLLQYESENFLKIPSSKRALLNLDYALSNKITDKKRHKGTAFDKE